MNPLIALISNCIWPPPGQALQWPGLQDWLASPAGFSKMLAQPLGSHEASQATGKKEGQQHVKERMPSGRGWKGGSHAFPEGKEHFQVWNVGNIATSPYSHTEAGACRQDGCHHPPGCLLVSPPSKRGSPGFGKRRALPSKMFLSSLLSAARFSSPVP